MSPPPLPLRAPDVGARSLVDAELRWQQAQERLESWLEVLWVEARAVRTGTAALSEAPEDGDERATLRLRLDAYRKFELEARMAMGALRAASLGYVKLASRLAGVCAECGAPEDLNPATQYCGACEQPDVPF